jgi:hypothetical protein
MRSPLGPFVLTAAIAVAQFAPSAQAVLDTQERKRPVHLANMGGALPEGAPMRVAAN